MKVHERLERIRDALLKGAEMLALEKSPLALEYIATARQMHDDSVSSYLKERAQDDMRPLRGIDKGSALKDANREDLGMLLPHATRTCRLCNGEPFVEWADKDKPRTIGATHHTCHPGEERGTLLDLLRGHDKRRARVLRIAKAVRRRNYSVRSTLGVDDRILFDEFNHAVDDYVANAGQEPVQPDRPGEGDPGNTPA